MLEEVYKTILDKVDVTAKDKFESLLRKSIKMAFIPDHDPKPGLETVSFKLGLVLEELDRFSKYNDKDKAMIHGTQNLQGVLEGLQFEFDESECFLLYQLRKLGRFRKREKELLVELKRLWKTFPQFELTDVEFSHALKDLMRGKMILYRKGVIQLNTSFVIRYRKDSDD
jgi:hypothetical protein